MDQLLQFLSQGGPFMVVIGATFFAALAVMIERTHFYQVVCRADGDQLADTAIQSIDRGMGRAALETFRRGRAPIHSLLEVAMGGHLEGHSFAHIKESVEEASVREVARLHRRVDYLAVIANVATLAGLLGTIFGLKESFAALSVAEASAKATLLAAGISQALNTTALGLMVAIPCMLAHAKLTARRNALLVDLDSGVLRVLTRLRRYAGAHPVLVAEPRPAPQAHSPVTPHSPADRRTESAESMSTRLSTNSHPSAPTRSSGDSTRSSESTVETAR